MDAHLEWLQFPLWKHLLDRDNQPDVLLRPVRQQLILFLGSLVCESVFEQGVCRKLALDGGDFRIDEDVFFPCSFSHLLWRFVLSEVRCGVVGMLFEQIWLERDNSVIETHCKKKQALATRLCNGPHARPHCQSVQRWP